MAKKWSNNNMPGALHFVTGNVRDRNPIFKHENYCLAFLEELQKLRIERECKKLICFVLMPEHFHFVANPRGGDIQCVARVLKSFSAKRIIELAPERMFLKDDENQVWQESFKALAMWSGWMIKQKIDYIHANPVKARFSAGGADYR
jgi:putative transposase